MFWPAHAKYPRDYTGPSTTSRIKSWVQAKLDHPSDTDDDMDLSTSSTVTSENINRTLISAPRTLLLFYGQWCRYCRNFHPEWEKAVDILTDLHSRNPGLTAVPTQFARVDLEMPLWHDFIMILYGFDGRASKICFKHKNKRF